jgi:hypothetical protein
MKKRKPKRGPLKVTLEFESAEDAEEKWDLTMNMLFFNIDMPTNHKDKEEKQQTLF